MARSCILLTMLLATATADERPSAKQLEFFEKKIRPVLVTECYSCHAADARSVEGGLLLDTREGIRQGGDSGHAVVPGHPEDSLILEALRHEGLQMPPKKQLPANVVADFEKWIQMGAPDPREGGAAPVRSRINLKQAREFWAFQPLHKHSPSAASQDWSDHPVDRFIFDRLHENGLSPSPDAEPNVLIRRLYFDLIGLPPDPQQADEFTTNPTFENYTAIVDRLLNSDQFGERWGRHWLDVVRFAESTGMERNYTYPEAWRYRNYVIAAFNRDKPFDQFLTEQVAGDLLPWKETVQRDEQVIATGMLAIGPKSLNERNREVFVMDIVDEQIDVVSRAFLGLTASCARCHDHKFDPIPQSDYYRLAGIFRSTNTYFGTNGKGNRQGGSLLELRPDAVVPASANGTGRTSARKRIAKLQSQLKSQQKRLNSLRQKNGSPDQINRLKEALTRTRRQLKDNQENTDKPRQTSSTLVMGVQDSSKPGDTELRIRGDADERGDIVPRGFLTVIASPSLHAAAIPPQTSGRLQLARWLVDPQNPLTARVAVNRIWQHLFGQGIVRTVNNFGANGDRPSHPWLLDDLAGRFVENGWSVKKLIRLIVTSRSYRQASLPRKEAYLTDPENRLVWRMNPRRLEAEVLRDAILAVSGTLDLSPGHESVVKSVGNGDIGRTLRPERFATDDVRRSVYLPIVRGVVPELLAVFDFPEPSIVAGARDVTTVPTQALYMMNSPFVINQSKAMASRLMATTDSAEQRLQLAWQLAFSRPPTADEIRQAQDFLDQACSAAAPEDTHASEQKAWTGLCQVLLASAEFRYTQ